MYQQPGLILILPLLGQVTRRGFVPLVLYATRVRLTGPPSMNEQDRIQVDHIQSQVKSAGLVALPQEV